MASLGEAVHAILAYDDPSRPAILRETDAQATLDRWGVAGFLAEDAIVAANRLDARLSQLWPKARRTSEVSVTAALGDQLVNGRIDLLIETSAGFVIVDHKSFPGSPDLWADRAIQYAPQLELYGQAVQAVTGRSCLGYFIHMPIVGALLQVAPDGEGIAGTLEAGMP